MLLLTLELRMKEMDSLDHERIETLFSAAVARGVAFGMFAWLRTERPRANTPCAHSALQSPQCSQRLVVSGPGDACAAWERWGVPQRADTLAPCSTPARCSEAIDQMLGALDMVSTLATRIVDALGQVRVLQNVSDVLQQMAAVLERMLSWCSPARLQLVGIDSVRAIVMALEEDLERARQAVRTIDPPLPASSAMTDRASAPAPSGTAREAAPAGTLILEVQRAASQSCRELEAALGAARSGAGVACRTIDEMREKPALQKVCGAWQQLCRVHEAWKQLAHPWKAAADRLVMVESLPHWCTIFHSTGDSELRSASNGSVLMASLVHDGPSSMLRLLEGRMERLHALFAHSFVQLPVRNRARPLGEGVRALAKALQDVRGALTQLTAEMAAGVIELEDMERALSVLTRHGVSADAAYIEIAIASMEAELSAASQEADSALKRASQKASDGWTAGAQREVARAQERLRTARGRLDAQMRRLRARVSSGDGGISAQSAAAIDAAVDRSCDALGDAFDTMLQTIETAKAAPSDVWMLQGSIGQRELPKLRAALSAHAPARRPPPLLIRLLWEEVEATTTGKVSEPIEFVNSLLGYVQRAAVGAAACVDSLRAFGGACLTPLLEALAILSEHSPETVSELDEHIVSVHAALDTLLQQLRNEVAPPLQAAQKCLGTSETHYILELAHTHLQSHTQYVLTQGTLRLKLKCDHVRQVGADMESAVAAIQDALLRWTRQPSELRPSVQAALDQWLAALTGDAASTGLPTPQPSSALAEATHKSEGAATSKTLAAVSGSAARPSLTPTLPVHRMVQSDSDKLPPSNASWSPTDDIATSPSKDAPVSSRRLPSTNFVRKRAASHEEGDTELPQVSASGPPESSRHGSSVPPAVSVPEWDASRGTTPLVGLSSGGSHVPRVETTEVNFGGYRPDTLDGSDALLRALDAERDQIDADAQLFEQHAISLMGDDAVDQAVAVREFVLKLLAGLRSVGECVGRAVAKALSMQQDLEREVRVPLERLRSELSSQRSRMSRGEADAQLTALIIEGFQHVFAELGLTGAATSLGSSQEASSARLPGERLLRAFDSIDGGMQRLDVAVRHMRSLASSELAMGAVQLPGNWNFGIDLRAEMRELSAKAKAVAEDKLTHAIRAIDPDIAPSAVVDHVSELCSFAEASYGVLTALRRDKKARQDVWRVREKALEGALVLELTLSKALAELKSEIAAGQTGSASYTSIELGEDARMDPAVASTMAKIAAAEDFLANALQPAILHRRLHETNSQVRQQLEGGEHLERTAMLLTETWPKTSKVAEAEMTARLGVLEDVKAKIAGTADPFERKKLYLAMWREEAQLQQSVANCKDIQSSLGVVVTFLNKIDGRLAEMSAEIKGMREDVTSIKLDVAAMRSDVRLLVGESIDELLERQRRTINERGLPKKPLLPPLGVALGTGGMGWRDDQLILPWEKQGTYEEDCAFAAFEHGLVCVPTAWSALPRGCQQPDRGTLCIAQCSR